MTHKSFLSDQRVNIRLHSDTFFHRIKLQIFTLSVESRSGRTAAIHHGNSAFRDVVSVRAAARIDPLSREAGLFGRLIHNAD